MLRIIHNISELKFSELMKVYCESNRDNGKERFRGDSENTQIRKAEEDFYHYLNSVFFRQNNSFYIIWEDNGSYKAALRLEPYCDGYLLCALETVPVSRNKGYATVLIKQTRDYLSQFGNGVIYSHVSKGNHPSLAAHRKCGFQITKDYAVYSDGSVLHNCVTLELKYEKTEI